MYLDISTFCHYLFFAASSDTAAATELEVVT